MTQRNGDHQGERPSKTATHGTSLHPFFDLLYLWRNLCFSKQLWVPWSSNRATRCAAMRGTLSVPWRTCQTDKTSLCIARSARRVRAVAFRQVTTADPEEVVPLPHHAAMEANPVGAHGRRNGSIASSFRLMRCSQGGPLFASSRCPLQTG